MKNREGSDPSHVKKCEGSDPITDMHITSFEEFKELAQRKDSHVPFDGVLLRLGQICRDAGKAAEAEQAFTRLVNEFPDSPFVSDARRELEQRKKT